jgi:hypothetical protein
MSLRQIRSASGPRAHAWASASPLGRIAAYPPENGPNGPSSPCCERFAPFSTGRNPSKTAGGVSGQGKPHDQGQDIDGEHREDPRRGRPGHGRCAARSGSPEHVCRLRGAGRSALRRVPARSVRGALRPPPALHARTCADPPPAGHEQGTVCGCAAAAGVRLQGRRPARPAPGAGRAPGAVVDGGRIGPSRGRRSHALFAVSGPAAG